MTDDYELICEAGRIAAQNIDEGRYLIGDLASQIKKQYGRDTVGRFAKDIGIPKARAQEYRQVCEFWPKSQREKIFEDYGGQVKYTHLKQAMRLKDMALDFIRECGENSYTCEQASAELTKRLGKPAPPEKLLDGLGLVIGVRDDIVTLRVDSELTTALYDAMRSRSPVSIVVRRSEEPPDFKTRTGTAAQPRWIDTRLVQKVG